MELAHPFTKAIDRSISRAKSKQRRAQNLVTEKRAEYSLTYLFAGLLAALFIFHFGKFIDHASPALVDDHDIIYALGKKSTASLLEQWTDLKNTDEYQELAQRGKATRFRPAFYPFKSLQTYLWGDNFRLWYVATFIMYIATTTLILFLLLRTFGVTSALVFAVFYLGHKTWADILPRLGPVEIECIFVGTILIWMLWQWIEDDSKTALYLSVPTALVFGAMKEADSVLMIAIGGLTLVGGLLTSRRRMVIASVVLLSAGIAVFAVLISITANAAKTGLISPQGPWESYRGNLDQTGWLTGVLVQLVLAAGVLRYFGKLKMDWTELLALLVACLSIEAMRFTIYYISFSMTYGGYNDAVGMRYGYPLALLQSIVAAIVFGRITQLAEPGIAAGVKILALGCIVAMIVMNEGLLSPATLTSRDWWFKFNGDAERVIGEAADLLLEARKQGKNPVLLATGPSLDWEPKLSLMLFLRRKMPDSDVYFDPNEHSTSPERDRRESIRFGGTPMSPEDRQTLLARGCIDVHVDDTPYTNPDCKVLEISLANRPRP